MNKTQFTIERFNDSIQQDILNLYCFIEKLKKLQKN